MTTIEQLNKTIETANKQKAWIEKHCPNITVLSPVGETVFICLCFEWNRGEILETIGQTFGTDGWISSEKNTDIIWRKEIDGFTVKLYNPTDKPTPVEFPVPQTAWPILLK